ncbi:putative protein [Arabidopsis thaliana]|nr:putative protein [Arabidopsis thaliana]CAB80300.1 putative protein [Arabidopsis thaliana]
MAKNYTVADVVNIDSDSDSDDDNGGVIGMVPSLASLIENQKVSIADAATVAPRETLECRSFWKAGENFVIPSSVTLTAIGMVEHARVHPKFLHSNATSHKWAFGAIAELLDNAVDEIQNGATVVKIDKINIVKDNTPALVFQGTLPLNVLVVLLRKGVFESYNGGGMDPNGIRKCMSLGYSSKKSNTTIGQYGNGFKTSTMRLGADAMVFSRSTRGGKSTQSIGLLSYTFLRKTGQDDVIVPMDIRLRDENAQDGKRLHAKTLEVRSHISYRYRHSLRAYISMLYLKKFKNFKIILRGVSVAQFNIADEFRHPETIMYKPQAAAVDYTASAKPLSFLIYYRLPLELKLDSSRRPLNFQFVVSMSITKTVSSGQNHCHIFGYQTAQIPADKSKRTVIPDQPPTVNTYNPSPLPSDRISHGGPIIREINLSNATSSRTAAVAAPHLRNYTGLRNNFQPVQLNPQPPAAGDTGNNLVGKLAAEIREENLQLFMRCEEYVKKENEVEQTVSLIPQYKTSVYYMDSNTGIHWMIKQVKSLEKELEEIKSKCAQLALLVDAKKKEMQQV